MEVLIAICKKYNISLDEIFSNTIENLVEKATGNGDKLTENRIAILRLIAGNPYISQSELAESIGISITA
ncbi:MAG: winged helix-turn-helix domain-containing protein, partial [Clostridia bacterium]|nr:winged helix-turn-helix domain-containing protein [Clostridia bacterium]